MATERGRGDEQARLAELERPMRTIKEEEVDLSEYEDYTEALGSLRRFLNDVYMRKRIHSALGYLTPVELEGRWRREHRQLHADHEKQPKECPVSGVHFNRRGRGGRRSMHMVPGLHAARQCGVATSWVGVTTGSRAPQA